MESGCVVTIEARPVTKRLHEAREFLGGHCRRGGILRANQSSSTVSVMAHALSICQNRIQVPDEI